MNLEELALFPDEPATSAKRRRPPSRRAQTSRQERALISAVAAAAGLAAIFSEADPAGSTVGDALLLAGFAATVTLAGSRARRWALMVLTGVAMVGGVGDTVALAAGAAAFIVTVYGVLRRKNRRLVGAVSAGLAVQALVRLPDVASYGTTAFITAAVVIPLFVSAYRVSPRRVRRRVHLTALAVLAVFVVGGVALTVATVMAATKVERGIADAEAGLEAARSGEEGDADRLLSEAATQMSEANDLFGAWWVAPARVVPVVGQHAAALEVATREGERISASGADAARSVDVEGLTFTAGRIDVDLVRAAQQPLADVAASLAVAHDELERVRSPLLFPLLDSKLDKLDDEVERALPDARLAAEAAQVGPGLLGGDGPRRYFVAFTTPAESRGLGGFMGNWAEITAVDGKLTLTRSGRTEEIRDTPGRDERTVALEDEEGVVDADLADYVTRYNPYKPWIVMQDVPLSPDFPTVAKVLEQLYPQTGGGVVDGVLQVDPYALAALLRLTGPITVEGLDRPLTSENAADFLLREQYVSFGAETDRRDFLDDATRETFERLTEGDIPNPREVSSALDPVVEQGRLSFHSVRPAEQALFEKVGLDNKMLRPDGSDYFSVVTQNGALNKIDIYLDREIDYVAEVDPGTGDIRATATVRLHNGVPSLDLPEAVIGSNDQQLPPGTNEVFFNFYTPHLFQGARLNGEKISLGTQHELGMNVYYTRVRIPPGGTVTLEVDVEGRIAPFDEYRLAVASQPLIRPDALEIEVEPTPGWRFTRGDGLGLDLAGISATTKAKLSMDMVFTAGAVRR